MPSKEEIQKEIDRLEDRMCHIVLDKKTDYVLKIQKKLHRLRRLLKNA